MLYEVITTICICDQCGGAFRIESSANNRQPILAVHVPVKACAKCQDQGRQWFEQAEKKRIILENAARLLQLIGYNTINAGIRNNFV